MFDFTICAKILGMKVVKGLASLRNFWPVVVILIFSLLSARTLFTPGYFIMHDDLQMMRMLEMEKCFQDWQIPCRWVPDMGYGFGFPLFNYYPPLPYLFGMFFRLIGLPFTYVVKFTFAAAILFSGLAMYFFAKKYFGKLGGVVSAIFYIWAPYHAVDVYVRGAMNESWAFVFFPLILAFSHALITDHRPRITNIIFLAFSWAALLLSHNLMVLIFIPVFAIWCLMWLVKHKTYGRVVNLVLACLLAFGLAAFFTLPVLVESKLVHVDLLTKGYYDFSGHFASIGQLLFSRFWGDGPSTFGESDGMAFPIGHIHWILSLLVGVAVLFKLLKTKKIDSPLLATACLLIVGWLSAFMAHSRSTPIWLTLPVLGFVQFPWRFLTLVSLGFSFVAGWISFAAGKLKRKQILVSIGLIVLVTLWNWPFFAPVREGPVTDAEKFSGEAWRIQQAAGIYDYLPGTAEFAPQARREVEAEFIEGKGILYFEKHPERTNWLAFNVDVKDGIAKLRLNVLDFPEWQVLVDGKEVDEFIEEAEEWGRIYIEVPQGEHFVYARLTNTPIRSLANGISLATWLGLLAYPLVRKRIKSVKI